MALSTVNFEQSGIVRLPLSTFTCEENIHEEMEAMLEQWMDVSTTSDAVQNVDWLDRMVLIYDRAGDNIILMIGGEASVTVESDRDIDDIETFAYQHLALAFDGALSDLNNTFDVKHSEMVA